MVVLQIDNMDSPNENNTAGSIIETINEMVENVDCSSLTEALAKKEKAERQCAAQESLMKVKEEELKKAKERYQNELQRSKKYLKLAKYLLNGAHTYEMRKKMFDPI